MNFYFDSDSEEREITEAQLEFGSKRFVPRYTKGTSDDCETPMCEYKL